MPYITRYCTLVTQLSCVRDASETSTPTRHIFCIQSVEIENRHCGIKSYLASVTTHSSSEVPTSAVAFTHTATLSKLTDCWMSTSLWRTLASQLRTCKEDDFGVAILKSVGWWLLLENQEALLAFCQAPSFVKRHGVGPHFVLCTHTRMHMHICLLSAGKHGCKQCNFKCNRTFLEATSQIWTSIQHH